MRSSRGSLLGSAAATELRDQRQHLDDLYLKSLEKERQAREAEMITTENDLIRQCIGLEGEFSFYRWWNDDEQVPAYGPRKERIGLLEKRIENHQLSVAEEQNEKKKIHSPGASGEEKSIEAHDEEGTEDANEASRLADTGS